jgi:hypothetical protein
MAWAAGSEAISRADAPSLSGEALPAVMVPSGQKAGFSPPRAVAEVSGRMDSSRASDVPGTAKVRAS